MNAHPSDDVHPTTSPALSRMDLIDLALDSVSEPFREVITARYYRLDPSPPSALLDQALDALAAAIATKFAVALDHDELVRYVQGAGGRAVLRARVAKVDRTAWIAGRSYGLSPVDGDPRLLRVEGLTPTALDDLCVDVPDFALSLRVDGYVFKGALRDLRAISAEPAVAPRTRALAAAMRKRDTAPDRSSLQGAASETVLTHEDTVPASPQGTFEILFSHPPFRGGNAAVYVRLRPESQVSA